MRGLLVGSGLCLTLGLLVSTSQADPPRWRPVAQQPSVSQGPASAWPAPSATAPVSWTAGPAGVSLRRPIPLNENGGEASPITPASFSAGMQPLARAKGPDQPPLPMPVGPGAVSTGVKQADKPATPTPVAPTAEQGNVWGDVVSQWVDGGPGHEGPVVAIPNGGACCGDSGPCGVPDCCAGPCGNRFLGGLFSGKLLGGRRLSGGACCDDTCCDVACPDAGCCADGACCPDGCWNNCSPCCSMWRFWGRAEYLLWWIKDGRTPVLVSGSPAGTPLATAGLVGLPSAVPLYGGDINYNALSGGRFTLGVGVPYFNNLGLESTFFYLGQRNTGFFVGSNGNPILARPVGNIVSGNQEAQLVAFPGVVTGSVGVTSSTQLWGIEGNLRHRLLCGCNGYLDVLGGFRYLQLNESLMITENLTQLATGANIVLVDSFTTKNQFYGGQIGIDGEYRVWRRVYVGGTFKLAMGVMHEMVGINGATAFTVPGVAPVTFPGGLLALPTNIGNYSHDHFAVIPEVGLRLGYQITNNLRVFVGYNFLYASNVVRPGDQISPVINRSQQPTAFGPSPLVGASAPVPLFRQTGFWAQGVNFGLEFRY